MTTDKSYRDFRGRHFTCVFPQIHVNPMAQCLYVRMCNLMVQWQNVLPDGKVYSIRCYLMVQCMAKSITWHNCRVWTRMKWFPLQHGPTVWGGLPPRYTPHGIHLPGPPLAYPGGEWAGQKPGNNTKWKYVIQTYQSSIVIINLL